MSTMIFGALEAGGTKMVCAIGDETGKLLDRISFPTETPETTTPQMISYFQKFHIEALGIGTFGPADLNPCSETYGCITTTPKLAWANYNIRKAFADALQIPVGFDTDVNAAALGEASFGCLKDVNNGIYITIGTGIGVGVLAEGNLLHGMLHPEGGHILLEHHPSDTYSGCCPYHKNCFEGLASGPSMEGRYGKVESRVNEVVTDTDGRKYAYIDINNDVLDWVGSVYSLMQAGEKEMTLVYKAKEATCLVPVSAVHGSGEDRYVFIVEKHENSFGSTEMTVRKRTVQVETEVEGVASLSEDISWYTLAYMEDRAISDGDRVMEYAD